MSKLVAALPAILANVLVLAGLALVFFGLYRLWGVGVMSLAGGGLIATLGVAVAAGSKRGGG